MGFKIVDTVNNIRQKIKHETAFDGNHDYVKVSSELTFSVTSFITKEAVESTAINLMEETRKSQISYILEELYKGLLTDLYNLYELKMSLQTSNDALNTKSFEAAYKTLIAQLKNSLQHGVLKNGVEFKVYCDPASDKKA
jgi:hypothetical protein